MSTPYWSGDGGNIEFQQLTYNNTTNVLSLTPFGNSVTIDNTGSTFVLVDNFGTVNITSLAPGANQTLIDLSSFITIGKWYRLTAAISVVNTGGAGNITEYLSFFGFGAGPGDYMTMGSINVGTVGQNISAPPLNYEVSSGATYTGILNPQFTPWLFAVTAPNGLTSPVTITYQKVILEELVQ